MGLWSVSLHRSFVPVSASAKGLDEGLIATTVNIPSFVHQYDLQSNSLSFVKAANRPSLNRQLEESSEVLT
jgi:hypothetical protein